MLNYILVKIDTAKGGAGIITSWVQILGIRLIRREKGMTMGEITLVRKLIIGTLNVTTVVHTVTSGLNAERRKGSPTGGINRIILMTISIRTTAKGILLLMVRVMFLFALNLYLLLNCQIHG